MRDDFLSEIPKIRLNRKMFISNFKIALWIRPESKLILIREKYGQPRERAFPISTAEH